MAKRNITTREKSRACKGCGQLFIAKVRTGYGAVYCGPNCRAIARAKRAKAQPLCVVDGCSNLRGYRNGLCNSCYYRVRRTGTIERRTYSYRVMNAAGYVKVKDIAHQMADKEGYIYEHRKVLYDHLGANDQACHWCGSTVYWEAGPLIKSNSRYRLVVDHLDGDKANNDVANLVPACHRCNGNRGLFMRWVMQHKDDPFLWQMYQRSIAA